ncbi:hypothetical protein MRX96_001323 [Rhipicephalus microplus]
MLIWGVTDLNQKLHNSNLDPVEIERAKQGLKADIPTRHPRVWHWCTLCSLPSVPTCPRCGATRSEQSLFTVNIGSPPMSQMIIFLKRM